MSFKIILLLLALLLEKCHILHMDVEPMRSVPSATEIRTLSNDFKGTWRLENDSMITSGAQSDVGILPKKNDAKNGIIISFFPDSTFTLVRNDGFYRSGKFKFNTDHISLESPTAEIQLQISFGTIKGNHRSMNLIQNNRIMTFAEYAYPLKDFREDPFYAENNVWRLKPSQIQNEDEIRAKLANYLQHNCYILKAATNRNQLAVSWEFSPGIIDILNSGIGIKPLQGVPSAWNDVFFSADEARKAYRIFENLILEKPYKGSSTGNWVKDDYRILTGLHATIQKPV